jgi:hypothetical protein
VHVEHAAGAATTQGGSPPLLRTEIEMKHVTMLGAIVALGFLGGCSVFEGSTDDEETVGQSSEAALTTSSGVPVGVLASYAFWNVSGPNIPQTPPAGSSCTPDLDAVAYHILGCMDASGTELTLSSSEAYGVYCSSNDGAGVTKLQAACLGGWLSKIRAVNGKPIPSNVVLTGVNKVAQSVTRVVLLECPTPPPGLSQHNVIYKAVYNDGIFAPKVPDGCTPYELAPH